MPIGSGFNAYSATLSALKRIEPVALYGNLSYRHAMERSVNIQEGPRTGFQGSIAPGDGYGAGMGISLAATPEISLDSGLSLTFLNKTRFQPMSGPAFHSSRATVGYLTLGAGSLLSKDLFLSISAGAGVTKDASDLVFSVALPYSF